ncbi:MAG: Rpp14/Pop5 family protein [Nanoarchaeota archaeon]
MKPLKPSQKENKRYLLISSGKLKDKELQKEVEKAILEFSGILGMSKSNLTWITLDKKLKGRVIACIDRNSINLIRASIAVYKTKIQVERVSGTLKSLKIK